MISRYVLVTGGNSLVSAKKAFNIALKKGGISEKNIVYSVATGYGKNTFPKANKTISEIFAQGKSIHRLIPSAKTIIDVGGQDVKGIKIINGKIEDFILNDKCAAGTGKFLEVLAKTLKVSMYDLEALSLKAKNKVEVSSTCTVFAESEVVTYVGSGVPKSDIIAGIHDAFATRIWGLIGRISIEKDVVLTGGVALNKGFTKALEDLLGFKVIVPKDPIYTGALGAALIAKENYKG